MERDAFAPRKPGGMGPGLVLALIAHALLIVALAVGVNWRASEPEGVVAELWSMTPQTAAPRAAPPEPVPPKPEPVVPKPEPVPIKPDPVVPKPEPVRPPAPPVAEPARPDPQIAIERAARERQAREEARKQEVARERERERLAEEREREKKRVLAEKQRLEAEKRAQAEKAEKAAKAEQARKEEARLAAAREANLRRMQAQAGNGDDAATGNAARTSGPSAGYAGRIKARIKPNIVLTGDVNGNPLAIVEVRLAPDGTIVGRRLAKSSGSAVWDETVLRAIDKTEVLPKDVDGRVPASMTIEFKPQE